MFLPTRYSQILTLNDVFPDYGADNGIFLYIRNYTWCASEEQRSNLNFDYYGMMSGNKIASRLIHKEVDRAGTTVLSNEFVERLAAITNAKFGAKWRQLWEQYSTKLWFENVDLLDTGDDTTEETGETADTTSETITDEGNSSSIKSGGHVDSTEVSGTSSNIKGGSVTNQMIKNMENRKEHTGKDVVTLEHTGFTLDEDDKSITNNSKKFYQTSNKLDETGYTLTDLSHTGEDIVTLTKSGTINDVTSDFTLASNFGFNSAGDAGNPYDKASANSEVTRTNDTTDTTTTTPRATDNTRFDRYLTNEDNKDETTTNFDKETHDNSLKKTFNNTDTTTTEPGIVEIITDSGGITNTDTFNNVTDSSTDSGTTETERIYKNETDKRTTSNTRTRGGTLSREHSITRGVTSSHVLKGMDYRRFDRVQELISLFENQNLFPFFEMVYSDVDSVLCIPNFK